MNETTSRTAVVTGGNSGIGKSILHKFSEAGFNTATCDINEAGSDDLPGFFSRTDLTRPKQIDRFCRQVTELFGTPDILVCNAGRGVHEKLAEGDPEVWEQIFQLNVFSSFRLVRAFVPEMLKKGTGDVVFISSVSSGRAYPYGGIYAASKAAVDQMAETLRLEVQPSVRVTVIHPGVVETGFFKNMIHGKQTPEDIGWGALNPGHVADSVLFAVTRPAGVALNDIVIRPAAQPM